MEAPFYIIAYDITDDKRRAKVAKLLESLAERVQGSVFEAYLAGDELEKLVKKLTRLIKKEEDSIRIYPICEVCRGKIRSIGQGTPASPPQVVIV